MRRLGATSMVLVLLLALGACGGGGSGALSSGYLKRANVVCDEWTKALVALGRNPSLGDTVAMARFEKLVVAVDTKFTGRFKGLSPAPPDEKALAPIYASFDVINDAEAKLLEAAVQGDRAGIQTYQQQVIDETAKVNVRLKGLGLKKCSG